MPEDRHPGPGRLQEKYVGVKEAAEILGWTKSKVSLYNSRGVLPRPAFELAAGPFWRRKDIEAYAEEIRRKEAEADGEQRADPGR